MLEQLFYGSLVLRNLLKALLLLSPLIFYRQDIFGKVTWQGLVLGVGVLISIFLAYILLPINLDLIFSQLSDSRNISATNFIFIAIYITFFNSFYEEYFFRYFLQNSPLVSSLLFSLYHISIFAQWFEWWVMIIGLFGLFCGGLLFHFVNKKNGIFNSWIAHIFADIAIVTIGFLYLF